MPAETVHFSVTGEFITEKARDFWNDEDAPEKAMNLLECVTGLSEAQRLDIVEGRAKLIGDSSKGIRIRADKAKSKTLKQIVSKLKEERDEARDEREDLVQMAIGDTIGMGSPTGLRSVPRRKTVPKAQFGREMAPGVEFDDLSGKQKVWRQEGPAFKNFDSDEDEDEEEQRPPPPAPEDKITADTGWLSPEGKFYPCGYAQHAYTAWKLRLTDNPQAHGLEVDGWARLCLNNGDQYFFGEHSLFNDVVNGKIRTYCQEKGIELPFWLREEEHD